MRTLLVFGWRELVRARLRAALIALILAVQVAALGGGLVAEASLAHTRDAWQERLRLADLDVRFAPRTPAEMPGLDALRAIPGVAAVSRRFVTLGYVEQKSGAPLPVLVHYLDPGAHPEVDDVFVQTGRFLRPGKPEEALVDRSFAESHELLLGDEIIVNPHRFATRLRVVGTALSPEHLVPTANPEMLVPHKGSLGVVYASREALDGIFTDELYDDLVFRFDPGADPDATARAVLAELRDLDVERAATRSSNFGVRFVDEMLSGSRIVMPTIAALLALMAAIVVFIAVNRLIVERRREIGCLLSLGYTPLHLVLPFLVIGVFPSVVGAALGAPGAMAFGRELARTSSTITGFPEPMMVAPPGALALATASALVVGVVATVASSLIVLRLSPSRALRGGGGELAFAGLPAVLERALAGRPSVRYALRNLFRRRRLSLATVMLVALAVAMPAGLSTSLASWEAWTRDRAAALGWDAVVTFKVPLGAEQAEEVLAVSGIGSFEGYFQGYATVEARGARPEEMRVRGLPVPSAVVALEISEGRALSADDADEAVVNASFSSGRRTPRVGETIAVLRRGARHELRVVGVVHDASFSSIYVPRATAQRIFGQAGKITGAYASFGEAPPRAARPAEGRRGPASGDGAPERIDVDELDSAPSPPRPKDARAALAENELVTSVQVKTEFAAATLAYLSAFYGIVVPFVGLGALLAFFFLLGVLGFLLLEREAEYVTLRTMGHGRAEIARVVLVEVAALGGLGLFAALGTWAGMAYVLRGPMARAWFSVPLDFRAHDFAAVAAPTFALLIVAALPGIRGLMRLDLSSALRGRGIG